MPTHFGKPGDLDMLVREHNYFLEIWNDTKSNWTLWDEYRLQQNDVWADLTKEQRVGRETHRTARAPNIVDTAVNVQMAFTPRAHRSPLNDDPNARSDADNVEKFVVAALGDSAVLEMQIPFKTAADYLIHYGYTVMWGMGLASGWRRGRPRKGKGENSEDFDRRTALWEDEMNNDNWFRYRALHPASVLMDPMEKMPKTGLRGFTLLAHRLDQLSLEKGESKGAELINSFEIGSDDPYESIGLLEKFTPLHHIVARAGGGSNAAQSSASPSEILWVEPNTWGYNPLIHAFNGWGFRPAEDLDANDPQHLAKGILKAVIPSLQRQHQEVSSKHQMLLTMANPKIRTRKDGATAQAELKGNVIAETEEGDYGYIRQPEFLQWGFQVGQETDRDIEEGTLSRALAGHRQEGVSTVGQQAILSDSANQKFVAPMLQMDHLGSIIASRMLRLIDKVMKRSVTIKGNKILLKEIGGRYNLDVKFGSVNPVLEQAERQLGLSEFQTGLISKRDYWALSKKEDASGIEERLIEDEILKLPLVQQMLQVEALRRRKLLRLADQLEEATEQQILEEAAGGVEPQANPNLPTDQNQSALNPRSPSDGVTELTQPLTRQIRNPGRVNRAGIRRGQ